MPNIVYPLAFVVFLLFYPLFPPGVCYFLVEDFFTKRRERRLAKKAPMFPCVKVLETKNGFAICESYYPPTGGPNMYRPGHIKTIRVLNTEHLVTGEITHVSPFRYSGTNSSISLKTTREKINMYEFKQRATSFINQATV